MYSRILVPLDGSDVASQSLPYAALLAQAFNARLDLLRAVPTLTALMTNALTLEEHEGFDIRAVESPLTYQQWDELHRQLRETAEQDIEAARASLGPGGVAPGTMVREGAPADAIVDEALAQPDTLVVMTTHGRSGLRRWVLGSVTDRVVLSPAPVVVIRGQTEARAEVPVRFGRVILPLDGSKLAEQAVPAALALAENLGTPITVLRSLSLSDYGFGFGDYTLPHYSMGDFATGVRNDVKAYLDQTAEMLRQRGAQEVTVSAPDGDPAETVLNEAENSPDSLIVMTTHGRSGIGRWVLGSVTDKVVRHSSSPVLVVRARV